MQRPEDKWYPYAKGGSFSPFYQDIAFLINWKNDAVELEASLLKKFPYLGDNANWVLHRESSYFKAGLKWPLRASAFAPQAMPQGVVFSGRSYAAFGEDTDLPWLLALLNSTAFDYLFKILLGRFGFPEFLVGTVQLVPFPTITADYKEKLNALGLQAWSLKRRLDTIEECSHAFVLPAALRLRLGNFDPSEVESELSSIHSEIDDLAFEMYGFSDDDRVAIIQTLGVEGGDPSEDEAVDDNEEVASPVDTNLGLLSWAIGVAFGRFDWRLATGVRQAPPEPDPFDPLPVKSPGMLPDGAEPFHAHSGILVDDQGHSHDLARLVEEVLARVGVAVPEDVRRWLQREFFAFHLQRYSKKSGRKAPIYWPLSTTSGSYTLWVNYPSLTSQTLYTVINDFIEPKLKQVGDDVTALRNKGSALSRDDEKQFEALQAFELELIELRDTLLNLAPSYKPNHDDGVQISAAPLWALFRHKPWQKVLKDTWTKLEKGDYDWAHLAMNYWPERVREKCKADKSMAIAHELEDLYVEPEAKPKKQRGKKTGV
uniref:Type II restriction endonuclease subunit M n=1 Tax=Acidithiobacillus sulfuriphilus TaxID=1867749 RepID=A0A3M8QYX5_9PROT|nr:type II restriction endonuclease subunit M [Acidithiobacillus sulfuriphilus]